MCWNSSAVAQRATIASSTSGWAPLLCNLAKKLSLDLDLIVSKSSHLLVRSRGKAPCMLTQVDCVLVAFPSVVGNLKSPVERPPSTRSVDPVIHSASSLHRYATACAMSSGVPLRGHGRVAWMASTYWTRPAGQ